MNHSIIVNALVAKDNKILISQRGLDEGHDPGKWTIPGGKVESTEGNVWSILEKTAKREVMEEIGIKIDEISYLASNCLLKEQETKLYLIFTSKYISGKPTPLDDTVIVRWFDVKDLSPEMLTPKTYDNIYRAKRLNK